MRAKGPSVGATPKGHPQANKPCPTDQSSLRLPGFVGIRAISFGLSAVSFDPGGYQFGVYGLTSTSTRDKIGVGTQAPALGRKSRVEPRW
jgi:hypothetical protein